jgi:hypothetical protein
VMNKQTEDNVRNDGGKLEAPPEKVKELSDVAPAAAAP